MATVTVYMDLCKDLQHNDSMNSFTSVKTTSQVSHTTLCGRILDDCVLQVSGLWRKPYQAAQDVKDKHSDTARDWRVVSGATQQVGDDDSLQ